MGSPPRFIVSAFHEPYHAPVWAALFARHPDAMVEAVLGDVVPDCPPGASLRAHRFYDLSLRADYGVPLSELRPLDAQTVEDFADVEAIFLRMADRIEMVEPCPYERRKQLYLRHLQYWTHVVETAPPRAVIFSNVPHEMHDHVLYEVCRRRGIPTLMFAQTQIEDTYLSFEDWRDPLPGAAEAIARDHSDAAVEGRFARHLDKQTARGVDPLPFYMREPARAAGLQRLRDAVTALGPPRGWPNAAYARWRRLRFDRDTARLHETYARLARTPAPAPYVYLPLHYQPELTTCPLAGGFVDQSLIVELLAAVGRAHGLEVWVKEHPKQTGVARDPAVYERWASVPNVRLLPRDADNYRLLEGATAVATCTGTPGWEALFRETPVLMFGRYFYQYAPGVHAIRARGDLERALQQITAGGGNPSLAGTRAFLRLLAARSHEGYVDGAYRTVSQQDDATAGVGVANVLRAWLEARVS